MEPGVCLSEAHFVEQSQLQVQGDSGPILTIRDCLCSRDVLTYSVTFSSDDQRTFLVRREDLVHEHLKEHLHVTGTNKRRAW